MKILSDKDLKEINFLNNMEIERNICDENRYFSDCYSFFTDVMGDTIVYHLNKFEVNRFLKRNTKVKINIIPRAEIEEEKSEW